MLGGLGEERERNREREREERRDECAWQLYLGCFFIFKCYVFLLI